MIAISTFMLLGVEMFNCDIFRGGEQLFMCLYVCYDNIGCEVFIGEIQNQIYLDPKEDTFNEKFDTFYNGTAKGSQAILKVFPPMKYSHMESWPVAFALMSGSCHLDRALNDEFSVECLF